MVSNLFVIEAGKGSRRELQRDLAPARLHSYLGLVRQCINATPVVVKQQRRARLGVFEGTDIRAGVHAVCYEVPAGYSVYAATSAQHSLRVGENDYLKHNTLYRWFAVAPHSPLQFTFCKGSFENIRQDFVLLVEEEEAPRNPFYPFFQAPPRPVLVPNA